MQVDELKRLLARYRIKLDKRLGQNFLLSEAVLDQIISAADLQKTDTVLEVGPGLGFLTKRLADKAGRVIAIEKDRKLVRVLGKIFKDYENVRIVEGDALKINLSDFRGQKSDIRPLTSEFRVPQSGYKLVANIPYYITAKLLRKFLTVDNGRLKPSATQKNVAEAFRPPSLIVLLLQKEVAERIIAKPGDMSILAVSVQFYGDPEIVDYVSKENFYPMPEVDSAILQIKVYDKPRLPVDEKKFFQLVKIGFSGKRKQLQKNLRGLPPSLSLPTRGREKEGSSPLRGGGKVGGAIDYKSLLSSLGINPLARAEDLSIDNWYRLYHKLYNHDGCLT